MFGGNGLGQTYFLTKKISMESELYLNKYIRHNSQLTAGFGIRLKISLGKK